MASLTYSTKALDNLPRFHRKSLVIFVEGQDDVLFWNAILKNAGVTSYQIKQAGGASEIDKYARAIINSGSNIVVARDCDYSDLLKKQLKHPRVLYTYGYSIENSLYCPKNIAAVIATYARSMKDYLKDVADWLNEFIEGIRELVELDFAKELCRKPMKVMGDNCYRFLSSNRSYSIDKTKISTFVNSTNKLLTKGEISEAKSRIKKIAKSLFYMVKGHFLTVAVLNFIKSKVNSESNRKISLSADNLFALLMSTFESNCMKNKDVLFVKKQINQLKATANV